ncbi:MAG: ferritin [Actinobacteria bacterium]|nr:ferritin [Actinomycetota bacterium]MBU1943708.1 ferritin [Actinomycetota bacterium]MBU2686148.1 ferritin [Actinomycetota bacterium]
MLTGKMQEALTGQLIAEMYSAYLYLSMSSYFESLNLPGFASWMRVQRLEELVHALKFFDYIVEAGGRVLLGPIDGPPTEWDGALGAFEAALAHEKKVTGLINDLVEVARAEGDSATEEFLKWYIDEQVEEEESAEEVVSKIKAAGDDLGALDAELAQRS